MIEKRDPWMKFYGADWRADPRLKMVSRAARSLWVDMISIMHEADPYGFLMVEGIPPSHRQLATLVGDPERDLKKWLAELTTAGIPSFVGQPMPKDVHQLIPHGLPDGTILSRRMVRDAAKRQRLRKNGSGGGNPALLGGGLDKQDGLGLDNQDGQQNRRSRLSPRSQKPEAKNPPDPPLAHGSWEHHRLKAIAKFGQNHCENWLFPCAIVPIAGAEVALEAPSKLHLSRISPDSQRLHDFFGTGVKLRLAEGVKP